MQPSNFQYNQYRVTKNICVASHFRYVFVYPATYDHAITYIIRRQIVKSNFCLDIFTSFGWQFSKRRYMTLDHQLILHFRIAKNYFQCMFLFYFGNTMIVPACSFSYFKKIKFNAKQVENGRKGRTLRKNELSGCLYILLWFWV